MYKFKEKYILGNDEHKKSYKFRSVELGKFITLFFQRNKYVHGGEKMKFCHSLIPQISMNSYYILGTARVAGNAAINKIGKEPVLMEVF